MKNKVDKEKLFRVCDCYGLDDKRALYYTNVIVIPGYNNLHLVLDKDCNVINVCEYENREGNKYNYFEGVYDIFNDDIISDLKLDPNGNLDSAISLGTIFKITDDSNEISTPSNVTLSVTLSSTLLIIRTLISVVKILSP